MPGEPGRAPPPTAVEVCPSVAPSGEADRISVSIIALAFLCASAGSTFASPGGNSYTWPPTAQTTGLDQVSETGIPARSSEPDIRCGHTSRGRAVPVIDGGRPGTPARKRGTGSEGKPALLAGNRLARTVSEAEAGQPPRVRRQDHSRRAQLDAVHVPRRCSLRRRVERGSDAQPALIGLRRPAHVRPRPRNARHCPRLGYPHRITLDHDIRVAYRHRDRTPPIARDVAPLARTRARLEPERAVRPEGTDRSHMRAAVLVDGGQPRRAGVRHIRSRSRPRIELLGNHGPIHRRQPIRLTQIDDLHIPNLPARSSAASALVPWQACRVISALNRLATQERVGAAGGGGAG